MSLPPTQLASIKKPAACVLGTDCHVAPFDFTMAFQPIVDLEAKNVFAYEALVRGRQQQGAREILDLVDAGNMYAFDQACRIRAIEMSAALGLLDTGASISINFMPGAVYRPENCIRRTLEAANRVGLPLNRIIMEVTEDQKIVDHEHLKAIFREYRKHGLVTAIDDFGAGYSGLNLLAEFQPDILKIDRGLVDHIDQHRAARSILTAVIQFCRSMDIRLVAEGIERIEEAMVLADLGIRYMQGYFFGRPAFEKLGDAICGVSAA